MFLIHYLLPGQIKDFYIFIKNKIAHTDMITGFDESRVLPSIWVFGFIVYDGTILRGWLVERLLFTNIVNKYCQQFLSAYQMVGAILWN